jgi:hypothetical protein
MLDEIIIEYAMTSVYFHQFASPKRPQPLALDQLVATFRRPLRVDLAQVQHEPAWNGKRYNAKLAEARALELADAPLGVKIVVLHHFLSAQCFIHCAYKELFKKVEPVEPGPGKPIQPKGGDGTEPLELLADVAERGIYDQVATRSYSTWPDKPTTGAKPSRKSRYANP